MVLGGISSHKCSFRVHFGEGDCSDDTDFLLIDKKKKALGTRGVRESPSCSLRPFLGDVQMGMGCCHPHTGGGSSGGSWGARGDAMSSGCPERGSKGLGGAQQPWLCGVLGEGCVWWWWGGGSPKDPKAEGAIRRCSGDPRKPPPRAASRRQWGTNHGPPASPTPSFRPSPSSFPHPPSPLGFFLLLLPPPSHPPPTALATAPRAENGPAAAPPPLMRAPDPPAAPVRAGGPALGRRGVGGHCGGCGALRVGSAPTGLFVQGELGVPIGHRGCWPGFGVVGGAVNCTRRVLAGGGAAWGGYWPWCC